MDGTDTLNTTTEREEAPAAESPQKADGNAQIAEEAPPASDAEADGEDNSRAVGDAGTDGEDNSKETDDAGTDAEGSGGTDADGSVPMPESAAGNGERSRKHFLYHFLYAAVILAAVIGIAAGLFSYVNSEEVRLDSAVEAGTEYAAQQQYELAAASFEEALSIEESQEDLETQILLMESLAGAGEYEELEVQLAWCAETFSEEEYGLLKEEVLRLLTEGAETAVASGDVNLAVELYEKVLELVQEGSDAEGNVNARLVDLYLEQAARTSIALYGTVLERDPENAAALEMTAELYESLESYEEAIAFYEQLMESDPDAAEEAAAGIARCWRAIAGGRSGSSAIAAWEESLTWDAYSEEAYLALAQLYIEEDDTQNAAVVLESGLALFDSAELQALYDEISVSEFEQLVAQIIESITTDEMTAEEKRYACYQYIIDTTTYVRTYEQPSGDWTKEYALDVLTLQQGNCFRYAAAFAYLCAELGYEVKVCTGEVSAARGGTTPHGWVVLTIDGTEYLCDPDLEQSLGYDFYMKTYEAYPVKPLITQEEWEIGF